MKSIFMLLLTALAVGGAGCHFEFLSLRSGAGGAWESFDPRTKSEAAVIDQSGSEEGLHPASSTNNSESDDEEAVAPISVVSLEVDPSAVLFRFS